MELRGAGDLSLEMCAQGWSMPSYTILVSGEAPVLPLGKLGSRLGEQPWPSQLVQIVLPGVKYFLVPALLLAKAAQSRETGKQNMSPIQEQDCGFIAENIF